MIKIKANWELFVSLVIFWVIMIFMLITSIISNNGHIVYALDDAYIHMAIAKNFSQHGVWGITRYEFSSSSSSLLYSLLLSLVFLIFGPNEFAPLIINLVFANLLIYAIYYILKIKNDLPSYISIIGILSIIFFLPLHFLVFQGMEHIIQVFINIIFIIITSNVLSDETLPERKYFSSNDKLLFLCAPLITLIRFEGMFLIIPVSFLLLLRKKKKYSIFVGILGFLPIIIYGLISLSFGWYFFPNSIILKGRELDITSLKSIIKIFNYGIMLNNPHIFILLLGASIIYYIQVFKKKHHWNQLTIMAFIFICMALFQSYFGLISLMNRNFSRYDAHLIAIGIILLLISIQDYLPQNLTIIYIKHYFKDIKNDFENHFMKLFALILIPSLCIIPFIYRAENILETTTLPSTNIYEQQYQMGLFLKKYYQGECVAANDIGAINYHADIKCLDLRGIGSSDIGKSIVNDDLDEEIVYKAAKRRDCKIAIIYEDRDYGFDIPSEWIKVGEWEIKNNVICADDTVSFWAVDPDEVDDLMDHLRDFSRSLPNTIIESGNYTK